MPPPRARFTPRGVGLLLSTRFLHQGVGLPCLGRDACQGVELLRLRRAAHRRVGLPYSKAGFLYTAHSPLYLLTLLVGSVLTRNCLSGLFQPCCFGSLLLRSRLIHSRQLARISHVGAILIPTSPTTTTKMPVDWPLRGLPASWARNTDLGSSESQRLRTRLSGQLVPQNEILALLSTNSPLMPV